MLLRKGCHLLEERFVVPVVVEPWSGCRPTPQLANTEDRTVLLMVVRTVKEVGELVKEEPDEMLLLQSSAVLVQEGLLARITGLAGVVQAALDGGGRERDVAGHRRRVGKGELT